jgi:non-lysosomal glucosylceramidase
MKFKVNQIPVDKNRKSLYNHYIIFFKKVKLFEQPNNHFKTIKSYKEVYMNHSKYYDKEELYKNDGGYTYKSDATEAAFLLGGIGTGNISVGARGELKDWEIFNWPGKKTKFPFGFFAIRTKLEGHTGALAKILEARIHPPYTSSHGYLQHELINLPRFKNSTLRGECPFAWVDFEDGNLPVKVSMEAFTPFIPLNSDDSGIPAVVIRYKVKNIVSTDVDVTIVGTLPNASAFEGYDVIENLKLADTVVNKWVDDGKVRGLYFTPENLSSDHVRYGNMAFMTRDQNVTYKTCWLEGEWVDGIQDFWDDFTDDGLLEAESSFNSIGCEFAKHHNYSFLLRREKIGSLGIVHKLKPGEEKIFEFVISWYFPNRVSAWIEFDEDIAKFQDGEFPTIRNYYAKLFENAWHAGRYLYDNLNRLEMHSRDFHDALFNNTTMPDYVIDAVASNITTIRSNTCFRIDDGTFLGYEGIRDYVGCGLGSVPHVWNYAQTLAFLFPDLERTMRIVEFSMETDDEGRMSTRMLQPLGQKRYKMVPACDGQLGSIVRLYRDWKFSGDTEFLKTVWDGAARALDYAFKYWDTDGDYVLDGQQNTTYDIEFYGPNPMLSSIFLAAVKAGAEMAKAVGDLERAEKYRRAFQIGSQRADEMLFDGEYYVQRIEDIDKYRYQHGVGCLSDQLLGQFLAHVAGLSYVLPEEHIKSAIKSVFNYNFKEDFLNTNSVHRAYAVNDEKGLIICSWPKGGRPKLPLSYSGEVWTGVEYQVATTLIYEGFLDEGLTMVKAIRERYDGYKRNPWSEVESGHHYTRAMASWGILIALSGYQFDLVKGEISFEPKINKNNFSTFWSTGKAWGIYKQTVDIETGKLIRDIQVLYGSMDGVKLI